jgi:hypothetical protein
MNSVLLGPAGRAGWTLPGEPRSVGVARELARADARGHIAVSVASDGLTALERRADELAGLDAADKPGWLAFCRQRAAGVMAAEHGALAARTADMEMEAGQ